MPNLHCYVLIVVILIAQLRNWLLLWRFAQCHYITYIPSLLCVIFKRVHCFSKL